MKTTDIRKFLFILVLLAVTIHVFADNTFSKNGFTYTILDDSCSLSLKRYQAVPGTDYSQPLHVPAAVTHDGRKYFVKRIESEAFKGVTEVLLIVIDEGIEHIGKKAFESCTNLSSIYIPASVESIGECLFGSCYSLISVVVDENNERYDSRDSCNAIIDSDNDELIVACPSTKIHSSVKSIGYFAFYHCNTMEQLIVPEGLEKIDNNAFYGCSSLKKIRLPESLMEIGSNAFCGCNSLTSIVIPKNVTSIGNYNNIFAGCNNLTSIQVDDANPVFDSRSNCNGIVRKSDSALIATCRVTEISDDIRILSDYCFNGTTTHSVTIPKSVTVISEKAFKGCYEIDSITVASDNPNYISPNGANALLSKDGKTLLVGCRSTVIPDGVETIGCNAFWGRYSKLILKLPETVKSIEASAFSHCSNLCEVIIPQSVSFVGNGAFEDCVNLAVLQMLSPVKEILSDTFSDCYNLSTICFPEGVEVIERGAFENCKSLEHITLPSSIRKIHDSAFANCPVSEKK